MKTHYLILIGLLFAVTTHAEEKLADLTFANTLENATLKVTANPEQQQQTLFELNDPGITTPVYAVKGMIRYENVEGSAYLQLDSHFAGEGSFFTKSLANSGPLQNISGSSNWRPFLLPFYANSGDQATDKVITPDKLTLSIYLPATGTVYLQNAELYQYASGEDPLASAGQWFSARVSGIVGGVVGTVIGLWGALIGVLAGRGKAKVFALGSANLIIALGIVIGIVGLTALAIGQPYAVYYPLLLIAIIIVVVVGALRKGLPQRYEMLELKKMRAMDG